MERPKPTKVIEVEEIASGISTVRMENALDREPEPGQFVMIWNGKDEKPMAVTTIGKGELTITVKEVGPFTRALSRAGTGEILGIRGPYGRPFDLDYRKPLLVGGGIGASPLLYLARRLALRGERPRIVLGFNSRDEGIYSEELSALGEASICCLDGSMGIRGTVMEGLPPLADFECVYTCGPERMIVEVARSAERAEVECQLLIERFFKCGIGLCGSCSLGRVIPCRDGPVFFWRELKDTEYGTYARDACGERKPID